MPVRLTEIRASTTRTLPSTRVRVTWIAVRGPKTLRTHAARARRVRMHEHRTQIGRRLNAD
eukprot:2667382-Pleurochrysis_carterae.AAC.2